MAGGGTCGAGYIRADKCGSVGTDGLYFPGGQPGMLDGRYVDGYYQPAFCGYTCHTECDGGFFVATDCGGYGRRCVAGDGT